MAYALYSTTRTKWSLPIHQVQLGWWWCEQLDRSPMEFFTPPKRLPSTAWNWPRQRAVLRGHPPKPF